MTRLKPYADYLISGENSIDRFPSHWKPLRIKYTSNLNPSKSDIDKNKDIEVSFLPMENILSTGKVDLSIKKPLSEVYSGYTYFRNGDIVIAKVTPCFENGNIALLEDLYNGIGFGTTELHVIRVKNGHDSKFFFYLLQSERFKQEGISSMYGVAGLKRVPTGFIENFKSAIPSLDEQKQIADFLDEKTFDMESLIADKEKIIQLLGAKRQAIITEAVTKGLNPDVKMKDSGVEWIGEIPEHWDVWKTKYKFEIKKEKNTSEEPTVLSLTQRGIKIKDLSNFEGQHAESYVNYQKVNINDFVMNSMDLLTGFVDCSKYEGVTSPDYRVFRFKKDTDCHEYYLRYFQICYWNKIYYGHGQGVSKFGRWRLQADVFKEFPIPIPSYEEQVEISKFIDEQVSIINELIDEIRLNINQIKEYRQSLIYEAVTGKIDVRDYNKVMS